MSVYKKLNEARSKLHSMGLKKSGHNKFAGYQFFELQDFIAPAIQVFNELGIAGVVSFGKEEASLTIVDVDNPSEKIVITSPMSEAQLKGCHPIQNLGAVQTYLRRYLWVAALEVVENDILDSTTGGVEPEKPKAAPVAKKPAAQPPVNQPTDKPWAISVPPEGDWVGNVTLGVTKALEMAETKEDVLQIFKINRLIFDELAVKDKAVYDDLLAMFGEAKKKFA